MNEPPRTLAELLRRAAESPTGVRFVDGGGEQFLSYADLYERARRVAGALIGRGVEPGDRIVLFLRTGPWFYDAFFGAALAGAVPVPLYPPLSLGGFTSDTSATLSCLRLVGCRHILTEPIFLPLVEPLARAAGVQVRTAEEMYDEPAEVGDVDPDAVAVVQFSSGTTGSARGVRLSHRQLLAGVATIRALILGAFPEPLHSHVGLCWLPLYHDMGLVGCVLTAMAHPGPLILLPPEEFLMRPARWLQLISRWRVTVSPAPNFAFGYCADRVQDEDLVGVDLSCWRLALNGAEAVTEEATSRFTRRLADHGFDPRALTPVYGLAEAGLLVAARPPGAGPRFDRFDPELLSSAREARQAEGGQQFASVGRPAPGVEVRIRKGGRDVAEGAIGSIHVRGASVFTAYEGEPPNPSEWFDTGDLGFTYQGELYVYGREKDIVLIRGRCHSPEPFELAAGAAVGVRAGRSAAFSVPAGSTEALVVIVERSPRAATSDEEIRRDVARRVGESTGLSPAAVAVWAPGSLPRTPNGKVRRQRAREQYLRHSAEEPP